MRLVYRPKAQLLMASLLVVTISLIFSGKVFAASYNPKTGLPMPSSAVDNLNEQPTGKDYNATNDPGGIPCPAIAGEPGTYPYTHWTRWYDISVDGRGNGVMYMHSAAYVCGNSGYTLTYARFYDISSKTPGVSISSSCASGYASGSGKGHTTAQCMGFGDASAGDVTSVGTLAVTLRGFTSCKDVGISFAFGGIHGADWDGHSKIDDSTITVCPGDNPPTGTITFQCTGSTINYSSNPADPDGGTWGEVVYTSTAQSKGDVGTSIPGGSNTSGTVPSIEVGKYMTLYVNDALPNGTTGDWYVTDSKKIAACDQLPTGSVTFACTEASAINLTGVSDSDKPTKSLRIDVYEDGKAGVGKRVYSGYTSAKALAITRTQLSTGYLSPGNIYTAPKYPPAPAAGSSTDWANHSFTVYIIGVNSAGSEVGIGGDTVKTGTIGPCAAISCGAPVSLGAMQVGAPNSFSVSVAAANVSTSPPPPVPGFFVAIYYPDGTTHAPYDGKTRQSGTNGSSYTSGTINSGTLLFKPPVPGTYKVHWTWTDPGYTGSNATVSPNPPCGGSGQAAYAPYFNVLGGDVAAGPGFGAGCNTPTSGSSAAGILGYNLGGNPNYYGAGTQLAALALGNISGFATALNTDGSNSSSGAGPPNGLAFANASGSAGSYGKAGWCVPDYAGDATPTNNSLAGATNVTSAKLSSLSSDTYKIKNDVTLNGGTFAAGHKVTLVVTGDVYITGDITYSYGSLADIPQFQLLATGNIYINNTVTELHGFYDAQPVSATGGGGTIYTCATGMHTSVMGGNPATDYGTCSASAKPLTFYGGVSAKKIVLGRTYGSLVASGGVTNSPAEQFVYTPELWLGNLTTSSAGAEPYQAFTSLPPIL